MSLKKAFLEYIAYPSPWYVYVSAVGWTAWVIFMVGYIIFTSFGTGTIEAGPK
jgi:hypothetical protein